MKPPERCDLAILTVTEIELNQMMKAFTLPGLIKATPPIRVCSNGNLYWKQSLRLARNDRELSIVIGNVARSGMVATTLRTVRFLMDYTLSMMVLAGIAGGWKGKVKIGDVIRPQNILDLSASVAQGGKFDYRSHHHRPKPAVAEMLGTVWLEPAELESHIWRILGQNQAPQATVNAEHYEGHIAVTPSVHDGVLACGDVLVRDSKRFPVWAENNQQLQGFEMETGGMVQALEQFQETLPWFVVRGISDFCDEHKSNEFQPYAAAAAAAYVRLFAERCFEVGMLSLTANSAVFAPSLPAPAPVVTPVAPDAGMNLPTLQTPEASSSEPLAVTKRWESIKENWMLGRTNSMLRELELLRSDAQFQQASLGLRARILRFEAEVALILDHDVPRAEALVGQADQIVALDRPLTARIRAAQGDSAGALEYLGEPSNLEEWNTRMNVQLQSGDARGMLVEFERPPDGVGPDTESHRLRTLALLTTKEVSLAETSLDRIKAKRPDAFAVRLAGAYVDYFRTLSPGAPESAYALMPNPVSLDFVKRDPASLAALDRAAKEFAELAALSANSKLERQMQQWQLAALANHIEHQAEAAALCAKLLAAFPGDRTVINWSEARGYVTGEDRVNALAFELGITL